MSEKRFTLEYDSNCYKCISDNEQSKLYSSRESICDLLNQLNDENERLKYINSPIDEEEMINMEWTNMECLLLLIPFILLFVLLTGIIIIFLVQLGRVVI